MKRYFDEVEEQEVFAGTAQEIRALYGSMARAKRTNYIPFYTDFPKFNREQSYELRIEPESGFYFVCRGCKQAKTDRANKGDLARQIFQKAKNDKFFVGRIVIDETISVSLATFVKGLKKSYPAGTTDLHVPLDGDMVAWLKPWSEITVL